MKSTVHSRVVAAPAAVLYDLVADVTRWPVIFGPSVHVEYLSRAEQQERFQLWALVGGEVRTWTSRRFFGPSRITFVQERSQPPIASMGGEWLFRALPGGRTEVVLKHSFAAVDPAALHRLTVAVDRNSEEELAALERIAGHPVDDIVLSFSDSMRLSGAATDAYTFVCRSDQWPDRLPHVRQVVLREEVPGVQDMEMETLTADGSVHTTRSVRLCFPPSRIVYKQLLPPALLLGHSGSWSFSEDADGPVAVARHTVAINPAKVPELLGADATLVDARAYLREALGANSRATLEHASAYAAAQAGVPHGTSP